MHQQIVAAALLHQTIELRTIFVARKKCRNALWLKGREALWSNGNRTQSSESSFFLRKKYQPLLRSLRRNQLRRVAYRWDDRYLASEVVKAYFCDVYSVDSDRAIRLVQPHECPQERGFPSASSPNNSDLSDEREKRREVRFN